MSRFIFCSLLLILLAGCESTGRTFSTSTSEESSSKKVIPPMAEDEGVQELSFVEPEEVPFTVFKEGFPKQKKIVVPGPVQNQTAVPANPIQPKTLQDIYFAFDKVAIRASVKPILETNADLLLTRYKDRDLLIEGHCDERGSMEYNLVLGARRAQAVKAYLVDLGIHQSRVRIVSYGKERSVCSQAHESCWQRNRRAHFVLR